VLPKRIDQLVDRRLRARPGAVPAIGLVLLAGACAGPTGGTPYLDKWLGQPLDNLIGRAGPPDREYHLSNGGRVIEYNDSHYDTVITGTRQRQLPPATRDIEGTIQTRPDGFGGYRSDYVERTAPGLTFMIPEPVTREVLRPCFTTFVADAAGHIIRWSRRGAGCSQPRHAVFR
jgi:hypothetical protein